MSKLAQYLDSLLHLSQMNRAIRAAGQMRLKLRFHFRQQRFFEIVGHKLDRFFTGKLIHHYSFGL